jgi:hypothetical protein
MDDGKEQKLLTATAVSVNCPFALDGASKKRETEMDEGRYELEFPQREAAFFYGLFLRGHSVDQLRQDIEVPPAVLAKWVRQAEREPDQRAVFERILEYRRHVLAIFESLLASDSQTGLVQ